MRLRYFFNALLAVALPVTMISVANAGVMKLNCHEDVNGMAFDYAVKIDEASGEVSHKTKNNSFDVIGIFYADSIAYTFNHDLNWGSIETTVEIDRQTLAVTRSMVTKQANKAPKSLAPRTGQCELVKPPVKKDPKKIHFRGSSWGDSKEDVIALKGEPAPSKDGHFYYKSNSGGFVALVNYEFFNNKLSQGQYIMQEKHDHKGLYIADYGDLKGLLRKKYGDPLLDEAVWTNEKYKKDVKKRGDAVAAGHLKYHSRWETESTIIDHYLIGANGEISHGLFYKSKQLLQEAKEEDRKRLLSNL